MVALSLAIYTKNCHNMAAVPYYGNFVYLMKIPLS